jgi:hypothetical protein
MVRIAEIIVDPLVWQIPLMVLAVVAALALVYCVYIGITLKMAKNRNRDPLGWILLSLFVSPLLTWIILLMVGDAER